MPQTYIKQTINTLVDNTSKNDWKEDPHEHTKMLLGNGAERIISTINNTMKGNRIRYRTAVHMISGHSALNNHLYRINRADSEICHKCLYDVEDVGHFLGRCPAFSRLRGEFFQDFYMTVTDIFDNNNINKIVDYALKTKRFQSAEEQDKVGIS